MNVDVSNEIVIQRPLTEVADYSANPDNAPAWYVNIKAVEWKTPPPVRVGSQIAFVAQFLGRPLAYTYEVVEFIRGERLVMRTAEGPFPMETTYTWAPAADGGTRMTLRNRGMPSGFSTVFAPFMARAVRRANRKDLAALKRLLEQRNPTPTSGDSGFRSS
jgi:uncharacterized membrane protein